MRFVFDEQIESQPGAVQAVLDRLALPQLDPKRPMIFAGLGTSLHAARVAAAWAGFPAQALDAHELALRLPIPRGAQVVVVTHGGKGPFAAAVLRKARDAGAETFAVVGEGAPPLEADVLLRTCPEERANTHSVSYVTALAVLGRMLGVELAEAPRLLREALVLPAPLEEARALAGCERILVAGFGLDAITASEAALKLKEATFQWAEGLAVEQALHGPHAALREGMGAILIPPAGDDAGRTEALRLVCEERKLAVVQPRIRECPEPLRPLVAAVPLQRLAAEIARLRGGDPDRSQL
jgi:glucosamine--fructose-6-phosphate aminotransferase (isomerizing)